MSNNIKSVCVKLPNWLVINEYKKFICLYNDIKPYIYTSNIKDNCLYLTFSELKEGCLNLNEFYMAISNINIPHILWGDNKDLSCWNYMKRDEVRDLLVNKWKDVKTEITIDIVKRVIMGVHLISQGCVSYADPCTNIDSKEEYIDKRIMEYMLSDLLYCPIYN